ncbi:MAG: hypothetical protein ACRD3N_05075 [Terracidiphilus sp.]
MRQGLLAIVAIFAMASCAGAQSFTVDLGASSQNWVQTGIGDNGSGYAQWFLSQGACTASGGNTTCTLSGNYTGSEAGYTGGTYSFVTTYDGTAPFSTPPYGTGPSPLVGISESAGNGAFTYEYLPPTSTMKLYLDETGGANYAFTIWNGSAFVNGFSVSPADTPVCGGTSVSTCSYYEVGETPGATITSTIDGVGYLTRVPEGGAPLLYLLLAAAVCGGAIFGSSRSRAQANASA